jgi:hypothetical protein
VEKTATILNQIITEKLIGFPVCAIVDADLGSKIVSPSCFSWGFRTIENALLDPPSIFEALEPYKEKAQIFSGEDVEKELLAICEEIVQDEIKDRLTQVFPSFHLYFKGKSIEELNRERTEGVEKLKAYFTNEEEVKNVVGQIQKITEDTKNMILDKTALLRFDGKLILGRFYNKRVSGKHIGMSFDVFCYSIAEKISKNGRVPKSIEETLTSIKNLFSREIGEGSVG